MLLRIVSEMHLCNASAPFRVLSTLLSQSAMRWRPVAPHEAPRDKLGEGLSSIDVAAVLPRATSDHHRQANTTWGLSAGVAALAGYAKQSDRGRGGKGSASSAHKSALELDLSSEETQMKHAVAELEAEMAQMRVGRANPGLVEPIMVELASGEHRPLRALCAVAARTAQLLVVTAYDPQNLPAVAQAICKSPLQLSARVEGKEVLVPMPRPSGEVIQKLVKQLHKQAEQTRIKVRLIRTHALKELQGQLDKDERQEATKLVQQLHDKFMEEISSILKAKEVELREHSSSL